LALRIHLMPTTSIVPASPADELRFLALKGKTLLW